MKYSLNTKCPVCKGKYLPDLLVLDPTKFIKGMLQWEEGGKQIQDAFPDAQSYQREQLQTGICSNQCWDEFTRHV